MRCCCAATGGATGSASSPSSGSPPTTSTGCGCGWRPAPPYWQLADAAGRTLHDAALDQLQQPRLRRRQWTDTDVMIWMPDYQPYSVWWFWTDGAFSAGTPTWRSPTCAGPTGGCAGVDTADQALDLWAGPTIRGGGRTRTSSRPYRPSAVLDRTRPPDPGHRDRLTKLAEAGHFPFDGTWTGFRPDAGWTVPALPAGHDRPRAMALRPDEPLRQALRKRSQ